MDIREFNKSKAQGTAIPGMAQTVANVSQEDTTPVDSKNIESRLMEEEETPESFIEDTRVELKEKGYEDDLYMAILDELVTKGQYDWDFKLLGKTPCKFRIRPDWVRQLLLKRMETEAPATLAGFTDTVNRFNLAGSLKQMGDITFNLDNEEAFNEILTHIKSLPFVVVNQLVLHLVTFDKIVSVATSPWALKAFTKPQ